MTAGRQRSAAILLLVLLLAMSATPFAAGGQTYGDVTVMDAALRDALAEGEAGDVHRVIVQFSSPLGEAVDKVLSSSLKISKLVKARASWRQKNKFSRTRAQPCLF